MLHFCELLAEINALTDWLSEIFRVVNYLDKRHMSNFSKRLDS